MALGGGGGVCGGDALDMEGVGLGLVGEAFGEGFLDVGE